MRCLEISPLCTRRARNKPPGPADHPGAAAHVPGRGYRCLAPLVLSPTFGPMFFPLDGCTRRVSQDPHVRALQAHEGVASIAANPKLGGALSFCSSTPFGPRTSKTLGLTLWALGTNDTSESCSFEMQRLPRTIDLPHAHMIALLMEPPQVGFAWF